MLPITRESPVPVYYQISLHLRSRILGHEWASGERIPPEARILSVADAYEAMTASRPYRQCPLDPEVAREELRRHAGTQLAPAVVDAFLRVLAS